MHSSKILPSLLVLALLVGLAAPAVALDLGVSDTVLGPGGVVFAVQAGEYGTLFPDGAQTRPENPVLVLRVQDATGQQQRFLVPNSEGDEAEGRPTLLFEEATSTLFLLWESWSPQAPHSRIHLVGFADGAWKDITELTGSPFVVKSSPQFAITRDEVTEQVAEGEPVVHQRSVLHLFWLEDEGTEGERILYAPQFLVDGELVASAPPRALNESVRTPEPAGEAAAPGTEPLAPLLAIRNGQDSQTLLVTFSDRASRQLAVLELRVVPGEVSALAGGVRDWLAAGPQGSPEDLVDEAQAMVTGSFGEDIQAAARNELNQQVAECLREAGPDTPAAELAEPCSDRLLGAGTELDRAGIKNVFGRARPQWIGVGYSPGGGGAAGPRPGRQHVAARLVSSHGVPAVMGQRPVSLLTSPDGEAVLVFWQESVEGEESIVYQEVGEEGWTPGNRLALGPGFSAAEAVGLLRHRVSSR